MVFSSPVFLYYFLPVVLIIYFAVPAVKGSLRYKNLVLLTASLVFYAWGEPKYVLLMIVQCITAWAFGLFIEKCRGLRKARVLMLVSVVISLSGLLFFKYTNFFIENINKLTGTELKVINLLMPIGISFYTFQIISYTIDLYKGRITAQQNPIYFGAFITSFPQLIAGPIVRYTDIADALTKRIHSLQSFAQGIRRFVYGLGKKVLLANVFGELVEAYKASGDDGVLFTWMYIIAFTLQIYFDFSGYSDMAIGLGKVFGFTFPENFNYPYIADNITNFWKRWHMTLSAWFRDYIYFPLGGSRGTTARTIFSLMFVWMVTGFWHGADWNFILWGGYFGLVLLVEKFILRKILVNIPRVVRHIYTLLIVVISWVFFDAADFGEAFHRIGIMFGNADGTGSADVALYYLRSYLLPMIIGVIAVTPLARYIGGKIERKNAVVTILEPVTVAVVLILSTAAIIDNSFNPFIYFRF